ncbi:MAG: hypothetical protein QOJ91_1617 [Sphingomonadales bacterium]|jgi:hypothetical protein|nr:hypothetical protein [Sphingomonadales bacterium]
MANEIDIAPEKTGEILLRQETGRLSVMPEPGPSPVIERLHALVRRGYKAELGAPGNADRVVLRHLGLAPDLVLHAGGDIEGLDARRPRHKRDIDGPPRIGCATDADQLRFMRFLDTVPPVSFRHRTRPWRKKYLYLPAVLVIVWLACVMLTVMIVGG